MEEETKKRLTIDAIVNAPTEISPEIIENTQDEIKKKKIIIIGSPEKVSPEMLKNIQEHYTCEIEFMSQQEFADSGLGDMVDPSIIFERLYDMQPPEIPPIEILSPDWDDKKLHAPYNPRKIGKVNNKKLSAQQKQHYKQRRGR